MPKLFYFSSLYKETHTSCLTLSYSFLASTLTLFGLIITKVINVAKNPYLSKHLLYRKSQTLSAFRVL